MGFRNTKEDKQNYEAFLAKFNDPNHKMTTDDCYTPELVYNAIREWVFTNLNVPLDTYVVRPFYPNGDYVNEVYPKGCLVLDNPPFSILAKIVKFYIDNNIKFFLFATENTLFSGNYGEHLGYVVSRTKIKYTNGAQVATAFITNLFTDKVIVSKTLRDLIDTAQNKGANRRPRRLNAKKTKYIWSATRLLADEDGDYEVHFLDRDSYRKDTFGGGIRVDDTTAEKIIAIRAKRGIYERYREDDENS